MPYCCQKSNLEPQLLLEPSPTASNFPVSNNLRGDSDGTSEQIGTQIVFIFKHGSRFLDYIRPSPAIRMEKLMFTPSNAPVMKTGQCLRPR